jgi:membrane protease YdiL (CAAX protease family)
VVELRLAIFVVGLLGLLAAVALAALHTARILRRTTLPFNPLLSPAENAIRFVLIVLAVGLGAVSGLPREALGWTSAYFVRDLVWGVVVGLAMVVLFLPVSALVVRIFGERAYSEKVIQAIVPRQPGEWLPVMITLLPAVLLEELLFRSLLVGGLGSLAPALPLAVLGSLLFGVVHLPQGIWGVIATTGAGLMLSLLFLAAGSLLAPIIAHYIFNVVQITLAMRFRRVKAR